MGTRHKTATSRCSTRCRRRTVRPHRRRAETSNVLLHEDARVTKAARSIGNRGTSPSGVEIDLPRGGMIEGRRRLQGSIVYNG
jgi:hypothetical protein